MQENDLKFEHSNKIHISIVNSWTNVISAIARSLSLEMIIQTVQLNISIFLMLFTVYDLTHLVFII